MKNHIKKEHIEKVLSKSSIDIEQYGEKTAIVKITLPNGFVIVESFSCVDPKNFDIEVGKDICMKKITDKIWELEGYQLQTIISQTPNKNIKERSNTCD